MTKETIVRRGDLVSIKYNCRLDDGTIVMSSSKSGPFEFAAGSGDIFVKVSNATIGMKKGEKIEITLKPTDAYGPIQKDLVKELPNVDLPQGLKQGTMFETELEGQLIRWTVRSRNTKTTVVDANHPLAGQTIRFEFVISGVKPRNH